GRDLATAAFRLCLRQQSTESPGAELRVEQAGVVAAGDEDVAPGAVARLVVVVDGDLVRPCGVAGQGDIAVAAAPQFADRAVDVGDAVADPLESAAAEVVAGAPHDS